MAKIAIYEGFGARRKKAKKSRGGAKRRARRAARKSGRHTDKAHTPQAMRFKRAATTCRKGGNATLKDYYACMKRELKK